MKRSFLILPFTDLTIGGAQDNQFADVIHFLNNACLYAANHIDNVRFVALVDGEYYKTEDKINKLNNYVCDMVKIHDINTINQENWAD